MNVLFETAIKLNGAGFPQPIPEFGQMWYADSGEPLLITNADGELVDYAFVGSGLYVDKKMPDGVIFAPSAVDIIREIHRASLHKINPLHGGGFDVFYNNPTIHGSATQHTEPSMNPAEACAFAWLDINKDNHDQ